MFPKDMKSNNGSQLFMGFFFIALGVFYFLPVQGLISWQMTGMLFAFLPAGFVMYSAWAEYRATGRVSKELMIRTMWGLFPFAFFGLWILGVSPGKLWPLVLVIIGATMIIGGRDEN